MEHHHRRIRRKAKAVHYGLIPLALLVPGLWIYFAYGLCAEAESPGTLEFCRVFRLTPLLPAALGLAVVAWIVRDLAVVGAEKRQAREPRLHHIRHGYRAIDERHRRHFRWALAQSVLVALALVLWLLIMAYRTTH